MKTRYSLLATTLSAFLLCATPVLAFYDEEPDIEALKDAAEKGDADAQFQLGSAYQMGEGVQQNDLQAVHWITKAANQGNADAQFNLGMAYRGGYGVQQDYITAYMWLELAVAQGSSKAFDLRRDLSTLMTIDQIEDAKYKARHWKPPAHDDE